MQKIPVRLAKPGMILAKPLLRDNGLVLVGEGTEISESLLSRIVSLNIETVVVKGTPLDLDGLGGSSAYAKRAERLDHLFRKFRADPFMIKLKDRLKEYFQVKAAAEEAAEAAAKAQEEADAAQTEQDAEGGHK